MTPELGVGRLKNRSGAEGTQDGDPAFETEIWNFEFSEGIRL
jgi:hypothetical protein